jgi:hypothetical protein
MGELRRDGEFLVAKVIELQNDGVVLTAVDAGVVLEILE